jgi:hypothetical protein
MNSSIIEIKKQKFRKDDSHIRYIIYCLINLITTQSNTTCIIAKLFRYENLKVAFKPLIASENTCTANDNFLTDTINVGYTKQNVTINLDFTFGKST